MEKSFLDEDFLKNTRLVLCPKCEKDIKIDINDEMVLCDECGEEIVINNLEMPEDFLWHPKRKY